MIRLTLVGLALVVASSAQAAQDPKELAQEILTKGAALFDKCDAAAMAATYTEDAEILLIKDENNAGHYKIDEAYRGRAAIEKGYAKVFEDRDHALKLRNTVEAAHFVGPDLLLIHGTFTLDVSKPDASAPFLQVRTKQGDTWRILTLQLFAVSEQ